MPTISARKTEIPIVPPRSNHQRKALFDGCPQGLQHPKPNLKRSESPYTPARTPQNARNAHDEAFLHHASMHGRTATQAYRPARGTVAGEWSSLKQYRPVGSVGSEKQQSVWVCTLVCCAFCASLLSFRRCAGTLLDCSFAPDSLSPRGPTSSG